MEKLEFAQLKRSLKDKLYNSYLITGKDSFLLSYSVKLITQALNISMPELNIVRMGDGDVDFEQVVFSLETMPFMSDRKLVVVDLSIKTGNILNVDALKTYLQNPLDSSIFVLIAGENKNFNEYNFGVNIGCDKISDTFIEGYIINYFKGKNIVISSANAHLINEYCLSDMEKVNSEIQKIYSFASDQKEISTQIIESIISKKEEYQIFELTESLAKKDANKTYKILNLLIDKKEDKSLISLIYNHFRRLLHVSLNAGNNAELSKLLGVKEYAVTKYAMQAKNFSKKTLKHITDLCSEYDYNIKSGAMDQQIALQLLILQILNA